MYSLRSVYIRIMYLFIVYTCGLSMFRIQVKGVIVSVFVLVATKVTSASKTLLVYWK